MTEYVLEILDGDRAGEIVELTSEPVTFGRRAGNSVVLSDEKVSGQHASLTLEGGQWVLRDHDSTNGTLIDGRRIQEVGLTANDIFQLGRVLFGFKEVGAPTPQVGQDMSLRTVDSARLANTKRGGGIGLLLVLVVVLGGGAGYWFYGGGNQQVGGGGRQPKSVIRVSGNMLQAGSDMESEGGWQAVSGLPFSWEESNFPAANSGNGYQSVFGPDSEDSPHYALIRSAGEYLVSSGSGVQATAFLQTGGSAKAAIRLRFWSTAEGGQSVALFTGSQPASYSDYTKVSFSAGVPSGCDHVAVEILGLLPDGDSEVSFDDVALEEGDAKAHGFMTKAGQRVAGCGGALAVMDVNSVVLSGLRPITTDAGLLELEQAGLLCLSDNGMELQVADADGAVTLNTSGGSGVSLVFAAAVASSGVLARQAEDGFNNHANAFELSGVGSLLIGYGTSRILVRLSSPAVMHGSVSGDDFVLSLPESNEISLVYDFSTAREKSRTLLGDAEAQFRAGNYEGVLNKVDMALSLYPHDDRQQRAVTKMRTQVRSLQSERVQYLEAELANAVYFESLGGYSRIRSELKALVRTYGQEQLLDPDNVTSMVAKADAAIGRIEAEEGGVARQKLQTLASVYGKAGSAELVALINQYIKDYLPAAGNGEGK